LLRAPRIYAWSLDERQPTPFGLEARMTDAFDAILTTRASDQDRRFEAWNRITQEMRVDPSCDRKTLTRRVDSAMQTALQAVLADSAPLRLTLEEALQELGAEDLNLAGVAVVDGHLTLAAKT
jgi:hypothetical protein